MSFRRSSSRSFSTPLRSLDGPVSTGAEAENRKASFLRVRDQARARSASLDQNPQASTEMQPQQQRPEQQQQQQQQQQPQPQPQPASKNMQQHQQPSDAQGTSAKPKVRPGSTLFDLTPFAITQLSAERANKALTRSIVRDGFVHVHIACSSQHLPRGVLNTFVSHLQQLEQDLKDAANVAVHITGCNQPSVATHILDSHPARHCTQYAANAHVFVGIVANTLDRDASFQQECIAARESMPTVAGKVLGLCAVASCEDDTLLDMVDEWKPGALLHNGRFDLSAFEGEFTQVHDARQLAAGIANHISGAVRSHAREAVQVQHRAALQLPLAAEADVDVEAEGGIPMADPELINRITTAVLDEDKRTTLVVAPLRHEAMMEQLHIALNSSCDVLVHDLRLNAACASLEGALQSLIQEVNPDVPISTLALPPPTLVIALKTALEERIKATPPSRKLVVALTNIDCLQAPGPELWLNNAHASHLTWLPTSSTAELRFLALAQSPLVPAVTALKQRPGCSVLDLHADMLTTALAHEFALAKAQLSPSQHNALLKLKDGIAAQGPTAAAVARDVVDLLLHGPVNPEKHCEQLLSKMPLAPSRVAAFKWAVFFDAAEVLAKTCGGQYIAVSALRFIALSRTGLSFHELLQLLKIQHMTLTQRTCLHLVLRCFTHQVRGKYCLPESFSSQFVRSRLGKENKAAALQLGHFVWERWQQQVPETEGHGAASPLPSQLRLIQERPHELLLAFGHHAEAERLLAHPAYITVYFPSKQLWLEHCSVTVGDAIAQAVTGSSYFSAVMLNDCALTEDDCAAIGKAVARNDFITALGVSNCDLDDMAVASLAATVQYSKTLALLRLDGNRIGLAGAGALATLLQTCTSLVTLNLDHNEVGQQGTARLCDALEAEGASLKRLHLAFNNLGDEGGLCVANLLHKNTNLEVTLRGNHISKDVQAKFPSA